MLACKRTRGWTALGRARASCEGLLQLEHGLEALAAAAKTRSSPSRYPKGRELVHDRCEHGKQCVRLVAVTGASNVLRVLNDLAEICRIARRQGARVLVNAAQLVAHRKVELAAWGIDYLALSAHKAYAPFGSGVLVGRKALLTFAADDKVLKVLIVG